jgi:dihydroorotate dehydrogenase
MFLICNPLATNNRMSWLYGRVIRPILFTQDAEQAHERTMRALAWVSRNEIVCDAVNSIFGAPSLPVDLFGLRFPNPVGLAAGMDKHAEAVPAWAALGFGFSELGGVTWQAQPGNPPPRLFRAVAEEAIVNRMGFNNPGAEALAQKLAEWRALGRWPNHPVGINLGKSKTTPLEKAAEDYANSFRVLLPHADFFVVNVSSPNTPNLRKLQDKAALEEILTEMREIQSPKSNLLRQTHSGGQEVQSGETQRKPILVKVAPDLSFEALDEIVELAMTRELAGIVATNTTIERPETKDEVVQRVYAETGGLSGRPLRARSTEIIRHIYRHTRGKLPIIGVGGIFDAADAWEKITAGASLIQIYTSLVYRGPGVVKKIVAGLIERMEEQSFEELRQAVGTKANFG